MMVYPDEVVAGAKQLVSQFVRFAVLEKLRAKAEVDAPEPNALLRLARKDNVPFGRNLGLSVLSGWCVGKQ